MARIISGISWPFRIADSGLPAPAQGVEVIRSALIVLLRTPLRSRVMRPNLGTDLQRAIFENQGPFLTSVIEGQIVSAVANFLPQVRIIQVTSKEIGSTLAVNIEYSVQNVRDETGFISISETGN